MSQGWNQLMMSQFIFKWIGTVNIGSNNSLSLRWKAVYDDQREKRMMKESEMDMEEKRYSILFVAF